MKRLFPLTLTLALALPMARADANQDKENLPFQTVTGVITEVRPAQKQVVLKVRKNEFLTLTADDRTRIDFPQTEGKLANLKEGKRVRVNYYVKDNTNRLLSVTEPFFTLGKVKQGINLALMFAKSASIKQRDEVKKNLQTILLDVDERIADLEAAAKKETDAGLRKLLAQDVEDLRRQREALREQVKRVDAATADNWNEVRDTLNNLLPELERLIERLRTREKGQP
jgi:hypothetical protein